MVLLSAVKTKLYQDSVRLMQVSETLSNFDGVNQAIVAMGTEANKRVLAEINLLTAEANAAGNNDLMIVIEATSDAAAQEAMTAGETILAGSSKDAASNGVTEAAPRTVAQAKEKLNEANLMIISVAGPYATLEAAKALHQGLHVFMFSDNVSYEDELRLKTLAASKGLLMMGPGCGTAVINGVALAFANVLKRGPVGIVGASGTGLQEVTSLIARAGVGISQAIGVGGRDLSAQIGGVMMRQAIGMLAADPQTELIILISKPPHPSVMDSVLETAVSSGKPIIVNFLGDTQTGQKGGILFTDSIEDTAEAALQHINGNDQSYYATSQAALQEHAATERAKFSQEQRYLRGLFSGGSLCDEAMDILDESLPGIYSNIPLSPEYALPSGWESREHSCIDMGEEEFTQGRPHPMIDPRLRQERLLKEAADPEVAVILMDVVIGYGSHENPAAVLAETIQEAKAMAAKDGRYLSVITHVCGTEEDPQGLTEQETILRGAGALVMPTNAQAARLATAVLA